MGHPAEFGVDGVRFDATGLVPVVVQDAVTAQVLMVAYQNREALTATLETGQVHFWSRSRNKLWRKGETSGNTLTLQSIALDCDADAILIQATPAGPTCHTGDPTCFAPVPAPGFAHLDDLWATIADRAAKRPDGSYTASLIAEGVDGPARKVIEEATEVVLAAKDQAAGGVDRIDEEAADLIYHLLVLMAERGVAPRSVIEVLIGRAG